MTDTNRLNALEVALNNELKEREFYLKNAERTANPLGQAMFRQIADDELEHYQRLKELHEKWSRDERWPDTLPLSVQGTRIKDTLESVIRDVADMPPGDDDDLAALRVAIEFESKGEAFYRALRDQAEEAGIKSFFDLLAGIEREHYLALTKAEEFLLDPAAYYTATERPGLDGA